MVCGGGVGVVEDVAGSGETGFSGWSGVAGDGGGMAGGDGVDGTDGAGESGAVALGVIAAMGDGGLAGSGAGSGVEGDAGISLECCEAVGWRGGDLWREDTKNRAPANKTRAPAPVAIKSGAEKPFAAALVVRAWPHSGQTGFPV